MIWRTLVAVVGIEEENGIAKRPVKGLAENEIDHILKEMVGYDAKISPTYFDQSFCGRS